MVRTPNGEPLGEQNADEVMKQRAADEDDDSDNDDKEANQQVAGGKVQVRNYKKVAKESDGNDLTDRLIDPLDGGDPNYKRKSRGSDISSAVVKTQRSHSPRDPYDR